MLSQETLIMNIFYCYGESNQTVCDKELTFVNETSTHTVFHVQPAAPASRANLAVPVRPAARRGRPAARPAPINDNFDWDDFHGIEVDYLNTVL